MTGAGTAPWNLPRTKQGSPQPVSQTWLRDRIVDAPRDVASHVARQRLTAIAATSIDPALCLRAQQMVERCGNLADVVRNVAQEIHLLEAEPGYDVSHSEPCWLHRVLVSVPDRLDEVGALRFTEGLIHEAMHLELTLLENEQALVRNPTDTMPSPWREEPRPIGGVLHGLYVFSCLYAAFAMVADSTDAEGAVHIEGRLHDISEEIRSIDLSRLSAGLTPLGCGLANRWSSVVANDAGG